MPGPPPASEATTGDWKVPQVPEDLKRPGIEISGPASITPMFINALNPGPDGTRAEGYLDDDEDSASHRLVDTICTVVDFAHRLGAKLHELDINPLIVHPDGCTAADVLLRVDPEAL